MTAAPDSAATQPEPVSWRLRRVPVVLDVATGRRVRVFEVTEPAARALLEEFRATRKESGR